MTEALLADWLSGDPAAVARARHLSDGRWSAEPHLTLARHLPQIEAAVARAGLEEGVAQEVRTYLWRLSRLQQVIPAESCACQGYTRSPDRHASQVIRMAETVHSGWSEAFYLCRACGRGYAVTTNDGYHVPQYDWVPH